VLAQLGGGERRQHIVKFDLKPVEFAVTQIQRKKRNLDNFEQVVLQQHRVLNVGKACANTQLEQCFEAKRRRANDVIILSSSISSPSCIVKFDVAQIQRKKNKSRQNFEGLVLEQ
jgi:hypothetical protein